MSMEVRRYKGKDWNTLSAWFLKRNMPVVPKSLLPPIGFVIEGIGAAFLYKTDGGIAILENYITNPDSTHEDRVLALDLITEALILEAAGSGYKLAVAFSQHATVHKNCIEHNFKILGTYEMFAKEL